MKRTIMAICIITAMLFASCTQLTQSCEHNYYRSDSTSEYDEYTCSECGKSYREAKESNNNDKNENNIHTDKEESKSINITKPRTVPLFGLEYYSEKGMYSGVKKIMYVSDTVDCDGWKHEDCYEIVGGTSKYYYIRYELNGKYSVINGELFAGKNFSEYDYGYLEFYDGEDLIATTQQISRENSSTEFEIDVEGVEFLTVYIYSRAGAWMIADITITKD